MNISAQDGGCSPAEKLLHAFADPALLRTALTHRSASRGARGSNERLEFLGDRVLGLVIAEWLLERFPAEREGDIGKRLGSLVAAETLAEVAEHINLAAMMIVPDSEARTGLSQRQSLLADALEAVIAALYLDGGLEAARRFVRAHWAPLLDRQLAPARVGQEPAAGMADGARAGAADLSPGVRQRPAACAALRGGGGYRAGQRGRQRHHQARGRGRSSRGTSGPPGHRRVMTAARSLASCRGAEGARARWREPSRRRRRPAPEGKS